jgi:hypothetical protein
MNPLFILVALFTVHGEPAIVGVDMFKDQASCEAQIDTYKNGLNAQSDVKDAKAICIPFLPPDDEEDSDAPSDGGTDLPGDGVGPSIHVG